MSAEAPWSWRPSRGALEVAFVGRGPHAGARKALEALEPDAPPLSWLRQIHSDRVVEATPGQSGDGDALLAREDPLALCVVTADCVPVILAGDGCIAAVHAGWRGLVAGVIPAALDRLGPVQDLEAWIGPAIGPCCYEVSDDVADQVVAASDPGVRSQGPAGRPHLDLQAAAHHQLTAGGVGEIHVLERCTRCHPEDLWSYRREGPGAGRNLAFVWRRSHAR
ncbi:MAG: peptidoglycan editing factor PgeF [Acidobacteria bacterium]|nr:peptidoglycan editing factor PgeF [Acidobacteriota bacterium]